MRQRTRINVGRGSHLPVLIKLMGMTEGPVVELGCGYCSTIFLHWTCFPTGRRLVTYEDYPRYFPFAKEHESDFHDIRCIERWENADLSDPWSIAFVDHSPASRRRIDIARLTHAEYIVVHDSEDGRSAKLYRYHRIFDLFKHRWRYEAAFPNTTVFSNVHDLSNFTIP